MSDNINWNETAIYDFLRFEHKPERQAAYDDRSLTKLANAGLIQRNEEKHTWKLTQKGEKGTSRHQTAFRLRQTLRTPARAPTLLLRLGRIR